MDKRRRTGYVINSVQLKAYNKTQTKDRGQQIHQLEV